ncbi:MAG: hypothetical protein KKD77_24575 [Gammaproteobacteria bacterium]|nr:hypothetical protein [Gammaproteobacteria bacterium]
MSYLSRMFSDDQGHPSSLRPLMYLVVLGVLAVWAHACITVGYRDIGTNQLWLIAVALGAKDVGKWIENNDPTRKAE